MVVLFCSSSLRCNLDVVFCWFWLLRLFSLPVLPREAPKRSVVPVSCSRIKSCLSIAVVLSWSCFLAKNLQPK